MGVRKLRLYQPKRYEKRCSVNSLPISVQLSKNVMAYKVSIPLCLLTPPELVVSFPVTSSYQEGPVQSLSHLQARLAQVPDVLPPEWINLTQSHPISDKVILAKFSLHALLGAPAFVITIDERLTWTLSCFGNPVEKQECRLLQSTPNKLTCVQDVITLLCTINDSRLCSGNVATDFQDAVNSSNGIFRDNAGI